MTDTRHYKGRILGDATGEMGLFANELMEVKQDKLALAMPIARGLFGLAALGF